MSWKKLLFPPSWLMVLLIPVSAVGLSVVFLRGMEQSILAYGIYAIAFYTLNVVSVFCVRILPKRFRRMKQKMLARPLCNRYISDRVFRMKVSLYCALAINLIYVCIHLLLWYLLQSWWYAVLAVMYGVLAVMRFLLARYVRLRKIGTSMLGEWKRSRVCACILLLINLSLSGAVLMILYQERGHEYPGIMIYVMALYTFYCVAHTVRNYVKYRKLGSPVMSTAKTVSLSAALVSVLNLETAMLARFGGEMEPQTQHIFVIFTGAGVSAVLITLSIVRIVSSTKEIRRIKHG